MNKTLYNEYVRILNEELLPATGCTEPIAVAYAAALSREALGKLPLKTSFFPSFHICSQFFHKKFWKKRFFRHASCTACSIMSLESSQYTKCSRIHTASCHFAPEKQLFCKAL